MSVVTLLILLCTAAPSMAESDEAALRAAVRELTAVQDKAAGGERPSENQEDQLLQRIKEQAPRIAELKGSEAAVFQDLILSALSGAEVPPLPAGSGVHGRLYEMVREGEYAKIDEAPPLVQDERVALGLVATARLALMRSVAKGCRDVSSAVRASRLAPGTVVEERTLRQMVSCALEARDLKDAPVYLERYARRFGRSLHRFGFLKKIAKTVAGLEGDGEKFLAALAPSLSLLEPEAQMHFQLSLITEGMTQGKRDLVRNSAIRARMLARRESPVGEAARLFEVIASNAEDASLKLEQLDSAKLSAAEIQLVNQLKGGLHGERGVRKTDESKANGGMRGKTNDVITVGLQRRTANALRDADAILDQ